MATRLEELVNRLEIVALRLEQLGVPVLTEEETKAKREAYESAGRYMRNWRASAFKADFDE